MQKVIIIGSPGAGKSTFARALREKTGLPLHYLDIIWHKPDGTNISREEFDTRLGDILAKDRWIIDGNYMRTLPKRLEVCDTVFLLDYPTDICLAGAEERIGKKREDMPWIEKQFDLEFKQWILDFEKDQLPVIYELLEKFKNRKNIIVFKTRSEAAAYIEKEARKMLKIRNEEKRDYEAVEKLTREAFYNMYMPGCIEHYLVRVMREHEDFIKDLDFVAELDGELIGNIMYTKAKLVDEKGNKKQILTFGPVSIVPKYQRRGYGRELLEYSFKKAAELGYDTIVIFGSPANYAPRGFKSCKKYNVCADGGKYPAAMLVKTLSEAALDGRRWFYSGSPAADIDEAEAAAYDDTLPKLEKKHTPSQEEFYIMSQSFLE